MIINVTFAWPNVGCHKLLLNFYPINGISNTPTNTKVNA